MVPFDKFFYYNLILYIAIESGQSPFKVIKEVRVNDVADFELGQEISAEIFQIGELVHVMGRSKGKGFAGTVKRWNFSIGPRSHGGMNKRPPGSIGCSATPARVIKGRKMPGQMGGGQATAINLEIIDIDSEKNILFVKGAVPGSRNGLVLISNLEEFSLEKKEEPKEKKEEAKPSEKKVEKKPKAEKEKKESSFAKATDDMEKKEEAPKQKKEEA